MVNKEIKLSIKAGIFFFTILLIYSIVFSLPITDINILTSLIVIPTLLSFYLMCKIIVDYNNKIEKKGVDK